MNKGKVILQGCQNLEEDLGTRWVFHLCALASAHCVGWGSRASLESSCSSPEEPEHRACWKVVALGWQQGWGRGMVVIPRKNKAGKGSSSWLLNPSHAKGRSKAAGSYQRAPSWNLISHPPNLRQTVPKLDKTLTFFGGTWQNPEILKESQCPEYGQNLELPNK